MDFNVPLKVVHRQQQQLIVYDFGPKHSIHTVWITEWRLLLGRFALWLWCMSFGWIENISPLFQRNLMLFLTRFERIALWLYDRTNLSNIDRIANHDAQVQIVEHEIKTNFTINSNVSSGCKWCVQKLRKRYLLCLCFVLCPVSFSFHVITEGFQATTQPQTHTIASRWMRNTTELAVKRVEFGCDERRAHQPTYAITSRKWHKNAEETKRKNKRNEQTEEIYGRIFKKATISPHCSPTITAYEARHLDNVYNEDHALRVDKRRFFTVSDMR